MSNTNQNTLGRQETTSGNPPNAWNCRSRVECHVIGNKCQSAEVVYKARVITENKEFSYIGATGGRLKVRVNNHLYSFRNKNMKCATSLSKLIWDLKFRKIAYKVQWEIIKQSKKYYLGSKICRLCLDELILILRLKESIINDRMEIFGKCRHSLAASFSNIPDS